VTISSIQVVLRPQFEPGKKVNQSLSKYDPLKPSLNILEYPLGNTSFLELISTLIDAVDDKSPIAEGKQS